jgi:hemin uptake protein HemP
MADGDLDRYREAPPRAAVPRAAVRSDDLFRGTHEIVIVHRDEEYRLRITRAGKLILTK